MNSNDNLAIVAVCMLAPPRAGPKPYLTCLVCHMQLQSQLTQAQSRIRQLQHRAAASPQAEPQLRFQPQQHQPQNSHHHPNNQPQNFTTHSHHLPNNHAPNHAPSHAEDIAHEHDPHIGPPEQGYSGSAGVGAPAASMDRPEATATPSHHHNSADADHNSLHSPQDAGAHNSVHHRHSAEAGHNSVHHRQGAGPHLATRDNLSHDRPHDRPHDRSQDSSRERSIYSSEGPHARPLPPQPSPHPQLFTASEHSHPSHQSAWPLPPQPSSHPHLFTTSEHSHQSHQSQQSQQCSATAAPAAAAPGNLAPSFDSLYRSANRGRRADVHGAGASFSSGGQQQKRSTAAGMRVDVHGPSDPGPSTHSGITYQQQQQQQRTTASAPTPSGGQPDLRDDASSGRGRRVSRQGISLHDLGVSAGTPGQGRPPLLYGDTDASCEASAHSAAGETRASSRRRSRPGSASHLARWEQRLEVCYAQ